jgi:hypothetical protein
VDWRLNDPTLDHVFHAPPPARVHESSKQSTCFPSIGFSSGSPGKRVPRPTFGIAGPKTSGYKNKSRQNQSQIYDHPLVLPKCVRFVITAVLQAGAFLLTYLSGFSYARSCVLISLVIDTE